MDLAVVFDGATAAVMYVPTIFRASAIAILFLYGWALNVAGFDRYKLPFRKVLGLSSTGAQYDDIMSGVRVLLLVLMVCFTLFKLSIYNNYAMGEAISQVCFWISLVSLCLFSQQKIFRSFRSFFWDRFRTFFTFSSVAFVDVLTADALTSMSKLLADMQVGALLATLPLPLRYTLLTHCVHYSPWSPHTLLQFDNVLSHPAALAMLPHPAAISSSGGCLRPRCHLQLQLRPQHLMHAQPRGPDPCLATLCHPCRPVLQSLPRHQVHSQPH